MASQEMTMELGKRKLPLVWDTHTALATIVIASVITIAALRGSLKTAIQP